MLAKNIIRINGWKDNKRTHVDIEVPMEKVEFYNSDKELITVYAPRGLFDIAQAGFDAGLDAVTSFNKWNWVSKTRITEKVI